MGKLDQQDRPDGFPIWAAVFDAVLLPVQHFRTFFRAGWLPILIYSTVFFVVTYLQNTRTMEVLNLVPDDADEAMILSVVNWVFWLIGMGLLLLLVPAITNWVRLASVGPPPDGRFSVWEFGEREWRYIGRYFFVSLVAGLIVAASIAAGFFVSLLIFSLLMMLVVFLGFLGMAYFLGRVIPYQGAAALGDELSWSGSFLVTQSSARRLFWSVTVFSTLTYVMNRALSFTLLFICGLIFPTFPADIDGVDPHALFTYFADNHMALVAWITVNITLTLLYMLWQSAFLGGVYGYFRKP